MTRLSAAVGLAMLMALTSVGPRAQWKTHWSYTGAEGETHWGDLDPAYAPCKNGKEQSPIDIKHAEIEKLPELKFHYKSEPLKYLINNGYTIRVNYHDAPGSGSSMIVDSVRYQLMQLHFHRPSEEYVDGKPYPMVLHLMHQSSNGRIAGVAVLLKVGHANAEVQKLWDHMPMTETGEEAIAGVEIDPARMLPSDSKYYKYMGSLTAPPCTEGVTWFVLKTPVEVSAAQITAFAKLYPHDVRRLQPLNGRVVEASQ